MTSEWQSFASYPDLASAEVVAGLLRSNGVPVQVAADEPVPGLVKVVQIAVPSDLLHRAKWVTSQVQSTDAELIFLATGRLEGSDS